MKGRWIALGAVLGFALALTLGFVHAGGSMGLRAPGGVGSMMGSDDVMVTMASMHDSEAMQAMHAQMPAELREQCDALHEQMSQMMAGMPDGMMSGGMSGGMMSGGTTDGTAGVDTTDPGSAAASAHAAHHPDDSAG